MRGDYAPQGYSAPRGYGEEVQARTQSEAIRAGLLVRTRRQATGLLIAVTIAFGLSTAFKGEAGWLGWVQATALASMVGGLADWFAVTALFRRPLGLPIPHTAIVVERKDRFAETIAAFVQESFLSPEAVIQRLEHAQAIPRAAAWLSEPDNAGRLAARVTDAVGNAGKLIRDEDIQHLAAKLELAPIAGKALAQLTRDQRHEPLIDTGLDALRLYLRRNGPQLHARLGMRSPWWLPGPIGHRMVGRLLERTQVVLAEMVHDPYHPIRQQLGAGIVKLAEDLQTNETLRRRGEELKQHLLSQPQLRTVATSVWEDVDLQTLIIRTGRRLATDADLQESAQRSLEAAARQILGAYGHELVALVSTTINRWDAAETSRRLELLLGPDLQYIRINGTVVGALAGLALHALATV